MPADVTELYGQDYYRSHCGPIPYDRSHPHWLQFFGTIADELVRVFQPKSAFDAGCAHGFLLESLWDRGVETWGRDVSEFAVSQVRADVRPFCSVGSIAEPITGTFDLVTCIEVLEHMTEQEGAQAIAQMAAVGRRVVFSSSPTDLAEPTHINVKPPIYWLQAFAKHHFHPLITVTLPSITSYTLVFERRETKPAEEFLVACAEIVRGRMQREAEHHARGALSARVAELDRIIAQRDASLAEQAQAAAQRDRELADQRDELGRRAGTLLRVQQELAAAGEALRAAEQDLSERARATSELDREVVALKQEIAGRERAAERYEDELRTRDARLVDLENVAQSHQIVLASTTWRSTAALRSALGWLPRPVRRRLRQGLKLAYWSATLQLGRRLRQRRARLALAEPVPAGPELPAPDPPRAEVPTWFDAAYYLGRYADVAAAGIDPLAHYLESGRAEGRHPSALAAREAASFRLEDLCDPERDEAGPRTFDEAFRISVLTPTYNTDPRYLRELHQTLRNQRYANWEWVVVDDGSMNPQTVAALRALAAGDTRIKLALSPENLGISGASNLALASVSGTHTALVDHDDLLARDAFLALYEAWKVAPDTQLFYTDECKLLPDGSLDWFWAKPDWSPAYLENTMCLGHLSVYQTRFLRQLGGFRGAYDGTQDFDLALRASLAGPRVVHLAMFAYLWRVIPGSAATDLSEKHYAIERQGRAVLEYAREREPGATVVPGWGAGYWRIIYPLPTPTPLLSYVIPTGGGSRVVRGAPVDLALNCIRSFEAARFYPNREYVVIHNGDLAAEQVEALEAIEGVRLVHYDRPSFNFSEKLNLGVAAARGSVLCLLNDDVEAITVQGGEQLVAYLLATPGVGAIGPMCLREDRTIQQNGVVLLDQVGPAHAGDGQQRDFGGHQAMMRCRREAFCIGGAILFVDAALYREVGGFPEDLKLNYNDVEFCMKLRARGRRCVVDPGIEVYHFEGATKAGTSTVEQERFFLRHPGLSDPFFSRWFDQGSPLYLLQLRKTAPGLPFGPWLDRHIAERAAALMPQGRFKLSVCVSVYNQPKRLLEEMGNSVTMQTYANTEFVILDNGSSNPETLAWLEGARRSGQAVVVRAAENLGISGGNLRLLETMRGDFFVAVDADDFLSVDALQMLAYAIEANPDRVVFYSDEYKSDMNSTRFAPFFKPDFDPILLTNCCYPAHLMAMQAEWLRQVGAYTDPRATWCHDYDTLTRAMALGLEPVHVREALYAWRINPGSTASAATFGKPETVESQRFVLQRLLDAKGLAGKVTLEPNRIESSSGMWRLRASVTVPAVSVLDARRVWAAGGEGVAGVVAAAAAPGVEWVALMADPADDRTLAELSAPAWFDGRVTVVSGIVLAPGRTVRWSGGVFHGGGVLDPYAGQPFQGGGYHGALWCQRCVDVAAPVDVLIRAAALLRAAAQPWVAGSADLMVALGIDAQARGELVAVTPHVQTPDTGFPQLELPACDPNAPERPSAHTEGSRWYDHRLESKRPHLMPGLA